MVDNRMKAVVPSVLFVCRPCVCQEYGQPVLELRSAPRVTKMRFDGGLSHFATFLLQLGSRPARDTTLDHEKLTYRYSDVHGHVVHDIIA
jgi:hypothetical protein